MNSRDMIRKEYVVGGVILLTAVIIGCMQVQKDREESPFQDKNLLKKGMDKPVVWIYVNNGDVNSRSWADFMSRSSRVMNLPFLNLCYQTISKFTAKHYRIEVIGGLQDLAVRMGGWEALPTPLQTPDAFVREPELNWIRAAVLAKWGGLWVSPASICVDEVPALPKDKIVFFGTDADETFAKSTSLPSFNVVWAPKGGLNFWVEWERRARMRLETRAGGAEFTQEHKVDFETMLQKYGQGDVEIRVKAEISRKGAALRRIQLEDLLAAYTDDIVMNDGLYVPIPYPEILERETFGWFLRMSEDQILDSDMVISHLFREVIA